MYSSFKNWFKMTQYKILNLKFSNLQLNKLKSGIKNGTELKVQQILLVILMVRKIFHISCYQLTCKFQSFIKLLQIILQIIENYQLNRKISKIFM